MIHDEKHHEPTKDERQNARKGKSKTGPPRSRFTHGLAEVRLKKKTKAKILHA
jgi:hypothetical protein